MSSEKFAIMSLAIYPEIQKLLKETAKSKKVSMAQIVRTLVEQYLLVAVDEEIQSQIKAASEKRNVPTSEVVGTLIKKHLPKAGEVPVLIRIPAELKGNEAGLRKWLAPKLDGIVNALK